MPRTVIAVALAICAVLVWSLNRTPSYDDVHSYRVEPTPTTVYRTGPRLDSGIDGFMIDQATLDRWSENPPRITIPPTAVPPAALGAEPKQTGGSVDNGTDSVLAEPADEQARLLP